MIFLEKAIKVKGEAQTNGNTYKAAHLSGVIGISAEYKVKLKDKLKNIKIKKK